MKVDPTAAPSRMGMQDSICKSSPETKLTRRTATRLKLLVIAQTISHETKPTALLKDRLCRIVCNPHHCQRATKRSDTWISGEQYGIA
jgi:hypothetical protein